LILCSSNLLKILLYLYYILNQPTQEHIICFELTATKSLWSSYLIKVSVTWDKQKQCCYLPFSLFLFYN